ncbi:sensor histidine kinase [Taibaiella chishuiensis]|uniref:histidine kinase n=1 Tax=Taibaiella chishuiensis TaxID=1434707 RepID=A0A2P8D838_9BACT|nr:HAMP domain-containing sensor histidine kinase [Taibaiella chishuiensis]PSK93368.1 histidine kinase/DNA gyrase B/HSP90-like ATPase [Taibaiella chishuiensis]
MRKFFNRRTYLIIAALAIVGFALYYFNRIAGDMAVEEQAKVNTLIEALNTVNNASASSLGNDITFASKVITQNTSIPLIITDEKGNIQYHVNLDSTRLRQDSSYIKRKLEEFGRFHMPIPSFYPVANNQVGKNLVYYGDSSLLRSLKYYPLLLIAITCVFLLIVFIAVSNAQQSLQNQVWVGMSKETAHQIGTPLTSIVAWMELLKDNESNREWVEEMEKDVTRLQLIADRFSKIGSIPELKEENLIERLQGMVDYMRMRKPNKVTIDFDHGTEEDVQVLLSAPLFDWVIENLIRNALDAMEGQGRIFIQLTNQPRLVTIDISDTGKGIPKNNFKKVFAPGYSTKKRGWGLGLSLAKRIIQKYHHASIFVKQSEPGKGTTFRIIFRR